MGGRVAKRRAVVFGAGVLPLAVAAFIGAFMGVGGFTFGYGEGWSYFSTDPAACANCHIMQPYYDAWQKSSHHTVATCADCHLPHGFARKYVAKADNGFFHSMAFTLENFHEPIQIKQRNRNIAQENCLSCHASMVNATLPATTAGETLACIQCHADVGHGPM
jgi:cytochrome c nitrite reductase small subunit